jgi:hypothetical protein
VSVPEISIVYLFGLVREESRAGLRQQATVEVRD